MEKFLFSNSGDCFQVHPIFVEAVPLSLSLPASLYLFCYTRRQTCPHMPQYSMRTSFLLNVQERSDIHCVLRGLNFTAGGKATECHLRNLLFHFILKEAGEESASWGRGLF
uniref:Uncharacterized protein n=1 Tax=Micrurus carvalhoi TaxID=3147026 RepID=A0A2H6N6L2_9SAUR